MMCLLVTTNDEADALRGNFDFIKNLLHGDGTRYAMICMAAVE